MRKEYAFSAAKKNPYAPQLKKQIAIRLDADATACFKTVSEDVGIPYQSLINLYWQDCAASQRKLDLSWTQASFARPNDLAWIVRSHAGSLNRHRHGHRPQDLPDCVLQFATQST